MNRISITLIHECAMFIPASVSLAYGLWRGGEEPLRGRLLSAGDGTGTHCCSSIREGATASTDTLCKGFTAGRGARLHDAVLHAAGSLPCRSPRGWPQGAEQGGLHWVPTLGPHAWALVGGWLLCWGTAILCRSFSVQREKFTEFLEGQELGKIPPRSFLILLCEKQSTV